MPFIFYNPNPRGRFVGDCTIRAICKLTDQDWDTVNAGFTAIMDKICQLELDGKNQQISELQSALNEANRRASQNDQTAQILASQAAQTAALEQYLRPVPSPAYIVQNPNCCPQNIGCGCAA